MRVIGRLDDLRQRDAYADEQRLADVLARWSLPGNHDWLVDGVRRSEPFLQVSVAQPGSVLAWELAQLQALGYVAAGPFWVPSLWFHDAASYRRIVMAVAAHVFALPATGEAVYVPKARAELEPLLALWPHVLVLPTTASWSLESMVLARAWPVHALGVVARPTWADGRWCSPAEFFCHDVDHARFKVREDLLARGIAIPDAYRDGTTFDTDRGAHRTILAAASPHVDAHGWQTAPKRAAIVRRWFAAIADEPQRDLAEAVRWLLFELVHEKSLPIEPTVLRRELATTAHVDKLGSKCAAGFYAADTPAKAVLSRLADARAWLVQRCRETAP